MEARHRPLDGQHHLLPVGPLMPSLMLRGLSSDLLARVRAYHARAGLSLPDAAAALLELGLRAHERGVRAGQARAQTRTPEQQQAASRARWDKARS